MLMGLVWYLVGLGVSVVLVLRNPDEYPPAPPTDGGGYTDRNGVNEHDSNTDPDTTCEAMLKITPA